jgi:hypothetical protein
MRALTASSRADPDAVGVFARRVAFAFVGEGARSRPSSKKRNACRAVTFTRRSQKASASDALVVCLRPAHLSKIRPSKVFEVLAAGRRSARFRAKRPDRPRSRRPVASRATAGIAELSGS